MFTIHPNGLIAADIFNSPKRGMFSAEPPPPSLEEPAPGAKLSKSEQWWAEHVEQFRTWARTRYDLDLDRQQALVLMGVGHPTVNTIDIEGVEHMLGTPKEITVVDDGDPLHYEFGLIQPGERTELRHH